MTKSLGSYASLTELVLFHFDEHQKGHVSPPKKSRRRGSKIANASSNVTVQARVALLRDQVARFSMEESMSNMSLADNENGTNPAREEVASAILQCVDAAIATEISTESQEPIDRILELAACLSCEDEILAQAVIARAAEFSSVILERARSQGCKLLGLCVQYLDQDVEMLTTTPSQKKLARVSLFGDDSGDSGWRQGCVEAAEAALIPRLTDKSQAVRLAAIEACAFFASKRSQVIDSLLWNLAHDPSVANRVAALGSIKIDVNTIDHVIARVRDVKVKVRVEALEILSAKSSIHDLTPEQCAELVRSGLTDRCDETSEAATKMICTSWLKSVKFDPVSLLDFLGPTLFETECEKLARTILKKASDDSHDTGVLRDLSSPEIRAFREGVSASSGFSISGADKDNSSELLSSAQLFFARITCDEAGTLSAARKTEVVGKIVPDIPALCEILQKHITLLVASIQKREEVDHNDDAEEFEEILSFSCIQLLQLAKVADDLQEEGSRRHFITAMKDILSSNSTPLDLLEEAIRAMASAHDSEGHFLQTVSEILSELSDSDSEEGVDFSSSAHLRIVSILAVVLENTSSKMASHPILMNFSSYIIPAITSTNSMVREGGVICMGKYALLSNEETVNIEIKPLLLKVAGNHEEKVEIRGQATLAFCDLALLFSNILEPSNDTEEVSFISIIAGMLDHPRPAVVAVAAEVAAKLLFAERLHDSKIVAQLMVVFFHEDFSNLAALYDEEGDDVKEVGSLVRLQQLLTVFFPAYSIRSNKGRQALVESIGPLLAIVYKKQTHKVKGVKAPTWPIAKMIEYICSTVEMGNQQTTSEEGDNLDDTFSDPDTYINTRIAKRFGNSVFFGTITEYYAESLDGSDGLWHIQYDDGDEEDFSKKDLKKALKLYEKRQAADVCDSNSGTGPEDETKGEVESDMKEVSGGLDGDDSSPGQIQDEHCEEASSALLVAVAISKYLSEESTNLSSTYVRALCKVLGASYIDIEADDLSLIAVLKRYMDELRMLVTDSTSLRALHKLGEILGEAESEDDEEDTESDDESLIEALEAIELNEACSSESGDKENETEVLLGAEKGIGRRVSSRTKRHLASVNT